MTWVLSAPTPKKATPSQFPFHQDIRIILPRSPAHFRKTPNTIKRIYTKHKKLIQLFVAQHHLSLSDLRYIRSGIQSWKYHCDLSLPYCLRKVILTTYMDSMRHEPYRVGGIPLAFQYSRIQLKSIITKWRRNQPKRNPIAIQDIPREIVGIILTYLAVPDQVCFSLSCKSIFAYFQFFLEVNKVRLPCLLPREAQPILSPNPKQRRRIRLLNQLEDKRWKYCADCWNLHPHSAWYPPRVRTRKSQSVWRFPHPLQPKCSLCPPFYGQRGCMPYTGEVDICPCVRITFRDKRYIMATLEAVQWRGINISEYGYYSNFHSVSGILEHDCAFVNDSGMKVQVRSSLWVDDGTQTLRVMNRYHLSILPQNDVRETQSVIDIIENELHRRLRRRSRFLLYREIGRWRRILFGESRSSIFGWYNNRLYDVLPSDFDTFAWKDGMSVIVTRNVGKDEWPDRDWSFNCRYV